MKNRLTLEEFFTKVEKLSKVQGRKENEMKDEFTNELTMEELIAKVKELVSARCIDKIDPYRQVMELQEEVWELAAAILRDDHIWQEDAVGDILVSLIAICYTLDISNIDDCLWCTYDEIRDCTAENMIKLFKKEEKKKNEELKK